MNDERQPIKRGDKLIWRSPIGDVPVEAASNETAGIVVIREQGLISSCSLTELFPDGDMSMNLDLANINH